MFRVKSICLLNEQVVFDDVYDTTHGALVGIVHDQVNVIMLNKLFILLNSVLRIRASDLWIRLRLQILLFSFLIFKKPTKNYFFLSFSAYYFLKVHLHHFSEIKSNKKSHKAVGIKVFLTIFA